MQVKVAPYILAGGRSVRMGRDKAMLELGGQTLLARAVETLRSVRSLGTDGQQIVVTIVGERTLLEGADRVITDRHSTCGPLGGMEAALSDLATDSHAEWAFFIPVDMPFLAPALLSALLQDWTKAAGEGARVCYAVVDERPQPLVSLVHVSLHPYLVTALAEGRLKVTPVLRSACESLASAVAGRIGSRDCVLRETAITANDPVVGGSDKLYREVGDRARQLWFANLNTERELIEAETFLRSEGSPN